MIRPIFLLKTLPLSRDPSWKHLNRIPQQYFHRHKAVESPRMVSRFAVHCITNPQKLYPRPDILLLAVPPLTPLLTSPSRRPCPLPTSPPHWATVLHVAPHSAVPNLPPRRRQVLRCDKRHRRAHRRKHLPDDSTATVITTTSTTTTPPPPLDSQFLPASRRPRQTQTRPPAGRHAAALTLPQATPCKLRRKG